MCILKVMQSLLELDKRGFPSSAGPISLLDNNSQNFWPLSLTLHFVTLKENPFLLLCTVGSKRLRNWKTTGYWELTFTPGLNNVQLCVCVIVFFLIVKSYKQKSPETGKMLARQISQVENDLTLFFFFLIKRCLGFHLPTEPASVFAQPCTSAFECQGYIILNWVGLWYLAAQSKR